QRGDGHARTDLAAERPEQRDEGTGEGARSAAGERPAAGVRAGGEQEREGGGPGPVERDDGVAARSGEERTRRGVAEPAAGEGGGGAEGQEAEAGEAHRAVREVDDRPEHLAG